MSVEEYIKQKTDEMVNKFKQDCAAKGVVMNEENETYLRMGMSYGITLASMTLSQLPVDITIYG